MRIRIERDWRGIVWRGFSHESFGPGPLSDSLGTVYAWSRRPAHLLRLGPLTVYWGDWAGDRA